jgi:dihydrofolate reductase
MRKIVVAEFLSLDNVMEEPAWTAPYWNDQIAKYKYNELFSSDALLLGRVTYQGFAEAWPSRTDEEGFADRMNGLPKYVVSTSLAEASWNNSHIIRSQIPEEVSKLKQQSGMNILVYGSGALVETLMKRNLVDEYRLLVYPVVLGKGAHFFKEGTAAALKLAETQSFSSGVTALIYTPDGKD